MNTVATVLALVLIAAMFVTAGRFALRHFHGTFTAWGDSHYKHISGTDDRRS